MSRKRFSPSVGYVSLSDREMDPIYRECDIETIVIVALAVADALAEKSGRLSLVAYYDKVEESNLVQFRVRRSQSYR